MKSMFVAAALAAAAVGLAGCLYINVQENPDRSARGGSASCDAALYQDMIGRSEAAIDRAELPRAYRLVCHECVVTQDHRPDRLNLRLGEDGRVASVDCG